MLEGGARVSVVREVETFLTSRDSGDGHRASIGNEHERTRRRGSRARCRLLVHTEVSFAQHLQ